MKADFDKVRAGLSIWAKNRDRIEALAALERIEARDAHVHTNDFDGLERCNYCGAAMDDAPLPNQETDDEGDGDMEDMP